MLVPGRIDIEVVAGGPEFSLCPAPADPLALVGAAADVDLSGAAVADDRVMIPDLQRPDTERDDALFAGRERHGLGAGRNAVKRAGDRLGMRKATGIFDWRGNGKGFAEAAVAEHHLVRLGVAADEHRRLGLRHGQRKGNAADHDFRRPRVVSRVGQRKAALRVAGEIADLAAAQQAVFKDLAVERTVNAVVSEAHGHLRRFAGRRAVAALDGEHLEAGRFRRQRRRSGFKIRPP